MSRHFQREMDEIKRRFLELSAQVEEQIRKSIVAFQNMDCELAESIVADDQRIDMAEIDVEEECLKFLALYQPVATSLRFVVAMLKINHDLERIGDLGANIAKRVRFLSGKDLPLKEFDFSIMMEKSQEMLRKSLDALVNVNPELARDVCRMDLQINQMKKENDERIYAWITRRPTEAKEFLALMSVGRHLERIADHATNIAEDVIYIAEGEIIRHQRWT